MQLTSAQSLICTQILTRLHGRKGSSGPPASDLIKIDAASGMGLSTCIYTIKDMVECPYLFLTPDRHLGKVSLLEALLVELGLPSTPKLELLKNGAVPLYIQDIINMRGITVVLIEDLQRFNFSRNGLRPTYHNELVYMFRSLPQANFVISETEPVESTKIIAQTADHKVTGYKLHGFASFGEYYDFVLNLRDKGVVARDLSHEIDLRTVKMLYESLRGNLGDTVSLLSNPFLYRRHIQVQTFREIDE